MDNIKEANMTSVVWQCRQSGTAYYNSSYEPWGTYAGSSDPGYDPLGYAVEQAHLRGLEIHAWFNVFNSSSTASGTVADLHPEWICTTADGVPMTSYRSASPGLTEVRDYTLKVAMEIVRNYDIDGFHLDYVRWNEYDTGDIAKSASEIEQISKLDGVISEEKLNSLAKTSAAERFIYDQKHLLADGIPEGFDSWDEWRRWGVTEFVRTLQDSIKTVKPWVRLSPAALGKYNWSGWNGYYIVFQDAALWLNEGYIDQLMGMHYHWTTGEGFYDMLEGDCPQCWGAWITEGIAAGRMYTVGPPSYMLDDQNIWFRHPEIVERVRDVSWVDGFQFFSSASWDKRDYWQEAGNSFFNRKSKIKPLWFMNTDTVAAPQINLTQIDSLSYKIDVTPAAIESDHWFTIYRSSDTVYSRDNDRIVDIHFGSEPYSFTENFIYSAQKSSGNINHYYATMSSRYWIESSLSNITDTDSIPDFIQPPDKASHIRVLSHDNSTLKIISNTADRASEYRAYLGTDGSTFPDTISSASNTIYADDLQSGQAYFFRVNTANESGESALLKETFAGVPADNHHVLVVNGFDRSTNTRFNYITKYAKALVERGYAFSYTLNETVIDGIVDLTQFETVIWILGDESTADNTFTSIEQDLLKTFLKQGGNLFVSGAEVGWDLGRTTGSDKDFYNNYLKAEYVADAPNNENLTYNTVNALPGHLFDGLTEFTFDYKGDQGTYEVDWPDAINAVNGAQNILSYKDALAANIAAVAFQGIFPGGGSEGKLVYFGFPFETIYPLQSRQNVINFIFDFFEGTISDIAESVTPPQKFTLYQNYPNPFNPTTKIKFFLDKAGEIRLKIYDITGKEVALLRDNYLQAGIHIVEFNAAELASGTYIYELTAGRQSLRKRMTLLK